MDIDPAPVDPAPVDPAPVGPTPAEPAPAEPAPAEPAPAEPAPVEAAPLAPPPVVPTPVVPAWVAPAPAEPAPVAPAPVEPAPVEPAPVAPAPVEPPPVEPPPVEPAPVVPAWVEPAPVAPPPVGPAWGAPPPVAPAWGSPPPVGPPPVALGPGEYPVQLTITDARELSRLWGIPFLGIFVRVILAIPHFVVLLVLGIGMYVVLLLGWIPILLMGRVPGIQAAWVKEMVHRSTRVMAYTFFLFPGGYPPLEPGAPIPLDLAIDLQGRSMSRLWGIPFLGFMVRAIVLIPHLIVLSILFLVAYLGEIILWIPILITGKYPGWAISLYGGILRYLARVYAYLYLLPVPYPPFSLS